MSKDIQLDFLICGSCGFSEDNHFFRHIFKPLYHLELKGSTLKFNVQEWPEIEEEGKCTHPLCGKSKYLHGALFKHEFKSDNKKVYRTVNSGIPPQLACGECGESYQDHNEDEKNTHRFLFYEKAKNKGENDIIKYSGEYPYTVNRT